MTERIARRRFLRAGIAAIASAAGAGGALSAARRHGLIPPDHGGLFGIGETLTYGAQRLLVSRQTLAREFDRSQISKVAEVNGYAPENDRYLRLLDNDFEDWRLTVEGLVARPASFSLAELQRLPSRSQITLHVCEEGWSFIAEWTGVPLAQVLDLVGASALARYVVFMPYDEWWGSIDMVDALHPQTLLAYGMNGRNLSADHGAPLRLRVARQLGYASIKFLSRIVVTDSLAGFGRGMGSAAPESGYSWYAGI
jgi:DMSO/TMAO reductase YedYZ molybdopterin-dependent catalytic subunit